MGKFETLQFYPSWNAITLDWRPMNRTS